MSKLFSCSILLCAIVDTRAETLGPATSLDVNEVIRTVSETVRNRVAPDPENVGALRADSRLYRARFGEEGFSLTLRERPETVVPLVSSALAPSIPRRASVEGAPFEREAAFTLRTEAVTCRANAPGGATGDRALGPREFGVALPAALWQADSEGANRAGRILTPGVSERITARDGQTEWDFLIFDSAALEGGCDLVIEASLRTRGEAVLLGDPRPGEVIPDREKALPRPAWRWPAGTDRHVRMGEMVVKDATGRVILRALPEVEAGLVRLVIPADRLAGAPLPIVIDPLISVEYDLADPIYGVVPLESQDNPSVATDGSSFLAVWEDARSGNTFDVWGAILSSNGTLLTPSGFTITTTGLPTGGVANPSPAVAWNGTNYLVVWEDNRGSSGVDLFAARVDPVGLVLDPGGIQIFQAPNPQEAPGVASNGSDFLVVWSDLQTLSGDILGLRLDPSVNPLGAGSFVISNAGGPQKNPEVVWDGTDYMVVWDDERTGVSRDIYAARIDDATGTVLDAGGIQVSFEPITTTDQVTPTIAYDGTTFLLVTWRDFRAGPTNSDIYAARLAKDGTVFDPNGIAVSTAAHDQQFPVVAWDGANFFVSWEDFRSVTSGDILGARVTTNGALLDPTGIPLGQGTNNAVRAMATASNGAFTLTLTVGDRTVGNFHIYGIRTNQSGNVIDPTEILISAAANAQVRPVVAWDGTNYLVIWEDYTAGEANIVAARVTPAGTVLDTSGIAISTASNDQLAPAAAFDGTNYLVVWSDFRSGNANDLFGARVSKAGSVLDPIGIPILQGLGDQLNPAVAFNGLTYLVVWEDTRIANNADIYASRVATSGSVLDGTGVPVSTAAGGQRFPALAWDGTSFVTAWQDSRQLVTDIWAARLDIDGTVFDPQGIQVTLAAGGQTQPDLDSDGTSTLIVWEDRRSGTGSDIQGARLSSGGIVLDPAGLRISTATNDQLHPSVAWDGTNYIVVWQDLRFSPLGDIVATRVSRSGLTLPSAANGLSVSSGVVSESVPDLAAGPDGRTTLVYQRYAPELDQFAQRSFVRFFDECPAAGPVNSPGCGFEPLLPYYAFVATSVDPPPTFTWAPGVQTLFRVEWSKKFQPFKVKTKSDKHFLPGTSYTPDAKTWDKIVKLGKKGNPVFWRVLAQDPVSGKVKTPSDDTFAILIAPVP